MKKLYLGSMAAMVVLCLALSQPAEAQKGKSRKDKKLLGDGKEVAAQTGANPQSQVELISIPYDPTLPTFTVTVEGPFIMAAQDIRSGGSVTPVAPDQSYLFTDWISATSYHEGQSYSPSAQPSEKLGYGAQAQLTSVLTRVGNIAVIDYRSYQADPTRYPDIFIIRGTITEFTETDGLNEQTKGADSKIPGRLLSIAGVITDKSGLAQAGAVISQLNIGKKTKITSRTGMVGLDIQITRFSTGQIIWSGPCQGTNTTESATEIKHGLGFQKSQAKYQASALNQACRAALNQVASEIHSALKRQATSQVAALPAEAPIK